MLSRLEKEIQEKNARVETVGPWPDVLGHDPTLGQVLVNLVTNALKFVDPNVLPLVRLRAEEQAEFIRVWVEDNGIGIAYRGERYQIVHSAFLSVTNRDVLSQEAILCYSNDQLAKAVKSKAILDEAGMGRFNLDESNVIACIVSNYTVERVVGRQNFGLIVLQRSPTNGISFTVFKGTKRFLQFNYPDSQ